MAGLLKRNTQYVMPVTYCVFLFLAACAPTPVPTPFIPPAGPNDQATQPAAVLPTSTTLVLNLNQTPLPELDPTLTLELPSPTPATCSDSLKYLEDLTIPDGTIVSAGQSVDKQWRVQNDGSCDWDDRYRLKLVSGDPLGLPTDMPLYPARAGAEAIIQMTITAPADAGTYHTVWQAYNPHGVAFGQPVYVEIIVQ